jgi:hypothetical protein
MSAPARASSRMRWGLWLAGPMVATIFVRMCMNIFYLRGGKAKDLSLLHEHDAPQ